MSSSTPSLTVSAHKPIDRRHRRRSVWPVALGLLVLLSLALALRLHNLDRPPLWWDEGNNAYFAKQSLGDLLRMSRLTHDTDPPAHRLALKLWLTLWGDSATLLRLLSVVFGVLNVALVYEWARGFGGSGAGLLSAAMLSFSPIAVRYSQEAKGYALVAFFCSLSLFIWTRYLSRPTCSRPAIWIAYVLSIAVALGSHYYVILFIVSQGVWLGGRWLVAKGERGRMGRILRSWLLAQLAAGCLVLPWLLLTLDTALDGAANVPMTRGSLGLLNYALAIPSDLASVPGAVPWAAAAALLILVVVVVAGACASRDPSARLIGLAACLPLVLGFFVQLRVPFLSARFFLYSVPAICVVAALGLQRLRVAGLLLGALLAVAWGFAMPASYAPAVGPEEDLRPISQSLHDLARPGDGVVVGYIWQEGILRMLAPVQPLTYHLGWFDRGTVASDVSALFAQHPRLWLLTYRVPLAHPSNPGGHWLEHETARAFLLEAGNSVLALYLRPSDTVDSPLKHVAFGNEIRLSFEPIRKTGRVGDAVPVTLWWRASSVAPLHYTVFLHLVGSDERPVAQSDGEPQNGTVPFSEFPMGASVVDRRALIVPAEAQTGEYRLLVGIYDPQTGDRLAISQGPEIGADHCLVGSVQVHATVE